MIVALMSSYREGALGLAAARSVLPACDVLIVLEGAVGVAAPGGDPTPLIEIREAGREAGVTCYATTVEEPFASDASKRTELLRQAKFLGRGDHDPLWCFWIDGDELLLWSEYLPDLIARAAYDNDNAGFPIRIVELDGSVVQAHGRVFRGDLIDEFIEGSYQVLLESGMVVALPNTPICVSGGVPCARPDGEPVTVEDLAELRPPLAGEPHFLHRTMLRDPARQARRLSTAEPGWYDNPDKEQK